MLLHKQVKKLDFYYHILKVYSHKKCNNIFLTREIQRFCRQSDHVKRLELMINDVIYIYNFFNDSYKECKYYNFETTVVLNSAK